MYTDEREYEQTMNSECQGGGTGKARRRIVRYAEAILLALSEPVLVLDASLQAVMANPAFYKEFDISPGHLQGKTVEELVTGEEGNGQLRQLIEFVAAHDEHVQDTEVTCVLTPQSSKVLSVSARRLHLGEESAELTLVEMRDITLERNSDARIQELNNTLRNHEKELEDNNTQLESFTHSVAHDLRTPLRLVNKIAHLVLDEANGSLPANAKERMGMILDSTNQMGRLIEDLLQFAKIGQGPLKKRPKDLNRIARRALKDLKHELEGRAVDVTIEGLTSCQCDGALLKQVYLNLLSNAMKFTRSRESAEIHVGTEKENGETIFFVRDNGVGFDMERAGRMFQPFQRFHRDLPLEGSGVGLALARRIIERHGGRIWAESQVDHGAKFSFTLGE